MSLLGFLSDAAGGGLVTAASGLLSTFGGAWFKLKEKDMDLKHERAMVPHKEAEWAFTLDHQKRQVEQDRYMAEAGLLRSIEEGSAQMRTAAIQSDMEEVRAALAMSDQRWWVGAVRTLNRPALTWLSILILVVFYFWPPQAEENGAMLILTTLCTMCASAWGFWFGSRTVTTKNS